MSDEPKDSDRPGTDPSWVLAFLPGDPFPVHDDPPAPELPSLPASLNEQTTDLKDLYPPDLGGGD